MLSEFKQVVILLFITQSFTQLILLSSNKLEDTNIYTRFGQVHSFVPKWQLSDCIVQEFRLLVGAGCEELVPLIDGGELRLAHNDELFHEAEPAAVGGRVVVGVVGQGKILHTTDFL